MPRLLTASALIAASLMAALPAAAAQTGSSRQRFEEMASSVRALVETPAAARSRSAAEERLKAAALLWEEGKQKEAELALAEAYQLVTGAVIESRSGQKLQTSRADQYVTAAGDGGRAMLRNHLDSVAALLDAYDRIAPTKGGADEARRADAFAALAMAQEREAAGKLIEAQGFAEMAAEKAQALVIEVRQGDRLVNTLSFQTPSDEYRYEMDRNDSYRMLVKMRLSESPNAALDRRAAEADIGAAALRRKAERAAAVGNWTEAIKLMEQANKGLGQVLRASGLPIPG